MPGAMTTQTLDRLETRRLRAWELHRLGWSQRRIAAQLGVTQGAVCQWLRRAREGGNMEALRHYPASSKRPALASAQFSQIAEILACGAEAFGFQGDRWTTTRVAAVLKQEFGVQYHPAHVSRLLRRYCPG